MTAQQVLVTLHWFRAMSGAVQQTMEDLQVIEECLLPILKDNHEIPGGGYDISYHQMYEQWMRYHLPDYKEEIKDYAQ